MAKSQFETVIKNYIEKMPSLPTSVAKVLEICNDPNISPSDLNRVISVDPVLMGKVMKLINSAYYGLNQEITSLVRAIIMLGINTVKNLALSTAVLGTLGKETESKALNMDGFWRHSLCVGISAKEIAQHRNVDKKHVEEYFIAGLLHDIGKIPLNNRIADHYIEVLGISDRDGASLHRTEADILGIDHCGVGSIIAENWKLSQEICDAITFHHQPEAYEGKHQDLLYSVALANYFANIAEIGFSGNRFPEQLDSSVTDYLGIDVTFLEDELEHRANEEIERARVFLRIA